MAPRWTHILVALLMSGPACIIDGVVLPDERDEEGDQTGAEDRDPPAVGVDNGAALQDGLIFYSGTTSPILLAGAPYSTPGSGRVVVQNLTRNVFTAEALTATDGSFNMPVNAVRGETLDLEFYYPSATLPSFTTQILLSPPTDPASQESEGLPGDFTPAPGASASPPGRVQSPDGGGIVTVTGDPGTVSPSVGVVVANVTNGATGYSLAASDGSFTVRVAASSGDQLQIFAVEGSASNGGGNPTTLFVP